MVAAVAVAVVTTNSDDDYDDVIRRNHAVVKMDADRTILDTQPLPESEKRHADPSRAMVVVLE
jgi:hypothetical protein